MKQNVRCLQGKWNDGISSLKVRKDKGGQGNAVGGWGADPNVQGKRCVAYNVSTSGGEGGFRMTHDPNNFKRIGGRDVTGQICGRDRVQVELSKTDRQTGVVLKVKGKKYRFEPGDDGDRFERNWYRKYYTINVN